MGTERPQCTTGTEIPPGNMGTELTPGNMGTGGHQNSMKTDIPHSNTGIEASEAHGNKGDLGQQGDIYAAEQHGYTGLRVARR